MRRPFRRLSYQYHDAMLEGCEFSAERELMLDIRLDPTWNPDAPRQVRLRFEAIQNVDEVRAFFLALQTARPQAQQALAEIVGIVCSEKGTWVVDLARHGAVTIATNEMPQDQ